MKEQYCVQVAVYNYNILNNLIGNINHYRSISGQPITEKDLESLCDLLGGHNLDGELFDLNFGCICATIKLEDSMINPHFELLDDIEIWNDDTMICSNFNIKKMVDKVCSIK